MKATVTKKILSDGLGLLERVIPNRSSNPLITSMKIEVSETGLTLSGTNLEIDLSCFVAAEVQDPQSFIVPAHLFAQVVKNLSGELVALEIIGNELVVQCGGSEFKLQTGDLEAYPTLSFPSQADVSLDATELSKAFGHVRYAASNEHFQPVFRGIRLEHRESSARVVASDGYRVAICDFPATGEGQSLIIPARSVDELIRVLKDGEARFTYQEGMITVTTDRVRMNLKLLDGDFPDYERVIPAEVKLKLKVSSNALKESVNRVAVLADKNANNRIELLISENKLRLTAEGDYGRAQDTLEIEQSGSETAMSLAFNARHVLDALGPIDGDVELQFSGSTSPAIFGASGGGSYMAVVVALRV